MKIQYNLTFLEVTLGTKDKDGIFFKIFEIFSWFPKYFRHFGESLSVRVCVRTTKIRNFKLWRFYPWNSGIFRQLEFWSPEFFISYYFGICIFEIFAKTIPFWNLYNFKIKKIIYDLISWSYMIIQYEPIRWSYMILYESIWWSQLINQKWSLLGSPVLTNYVDADWRPELNGCDAFSNHQNVAQNQKVKNSNSVT